MIIGIGLFFPPKKAGANTKNQNKEVGNGTT